MKNKENICLLSKEKTWPIIFNLMFPLGMYGKIFINLLPGDKIRYKNPPRFTSDVENWKKFRFSHGRDRNVVMDYVLGVKTGQHVQFIRLFTRKKLLGFHLSGENNGFCSIRWNSRLPLVQLSYEILWWKIYYWRKQDNKPNSWGLLLEKTQVCSF